MFLRRNTTKVEPLPEIEKKRDIFQALKIFFFVNKLLLVAPYTIRGSTNTRMFKVVNNYDLIYYLRCLLIVCSSCYGLTYYMHIAARLKVVQAFLNTISITLIIPIIFINRNNFIKVMARMSELETKLKEYGIGYSYNKLFRLSLFQLFTVLSISVISQALVSPEFILLRKCLLFGLFVLPNAMTMLFLCQYINFVMVCRDWLEGLDEYMQELLIIEFEASKRLDTARSIYHNLWEITHMIGRVFQLPVLIILGITFLNTAAFVYLWLVVTKINPSTYLWFFSNILKICLLPLMCEICRKKVPTAI